MKNQALENARSWIEDGLTFTETIRQEYDGNNCVFSAGFVEGENKPACDTVFVRMIKDGNGPWTLLMRPDEAQALAWCLAGVVWSHLMGETVEV